MNKHILYVIIIGMLCSCSKTEDAVNLETEIVGNWKLIQMIGGFPNSETTGTEMEWQETYQIDADGTFLKSRDKDGVITEISGTYNLISNLNDSLLEFNFNSESNIIGSCTSQTKETMLLQSETIFLSTWNACDGPGLKYQKTD